MPEPALPQQAEQLSNRTATVVGFAMIALLLLLPIWAVRAAYHHWFAPTPSSFALSAYFVDAAGKTVDATSTAPIPSSHLRIQGDVYKQAQAVSPGRVRIRVLSADQKFDQSVSAPLLNGHFQLEDPAFSSVQPNASLTITAYVAYDAVSEVAEIRLNTDPPDTRNTLYAVIGSIFIGFSVWFVIAFTGRETPRKKRAAIILSYGIILLFLAVPILLPSWLLRVFPQAVDEMVGEPAGLVVTCTSSQEPKQHQWALNIGGYSFIPRAAALPASGSTRQFPNQQGTAAPTPASGANPASTVPQTAAAPSAATSPSPQEVPPTMAERSAVVTASAPTSAAAPVTIVEQLYSNSSTPGDCREFPPAVPGAAPVATATASPSSTTVAPRKGRIAFGQPLAPPLVEVQGGLVVPLYVIILSVIGGGINMTRKVPSFQMEDEASQMTTLGNALGTALGHLSYLGTAVIGNAKGLLNDPLITGPDQDAYATTSLADHATQVDALIGPLIVDQLKRRTDSNTARSLLHQLVSRMQVLYAAQDADHPAPFRSYDEWFASHPGLREVLGGSWRVELLNQYMYLISAPFLAIVTYYILDLLGLSKPGVVVVLSFSVGLISEKIVSWILGVATGYLRIPKAS